MRGRRRCWGRRACLAGAPVAKALRALGRRVDQRAPARVAEPLQIARAAAPRLALRAWVAALRRPLLARLPQDPRGGSRSGRGDSLSLHPDCDKNTTHSLAVLLHH